MSQKKLRTSRSSYIMPNKRICLTWISPKIAFCVNLCMTSKNKDKPAKTTLLKKTLNSIGLLIVATLTKELGKELMKLIIQAIFPN